MTIDYTRPPQTPGQPPAQQPQSWWSRNWKWVITLGCLTPLLLAGGCIAGLVMFVFGAIRSSEPYKEALQRAQANPEVINRLGSPLEGKWWLTGNVNVKDDSGTAQIVIPIRGPKGEGAIHVTGTKDSGRWTYQRMEVETSSGPRINLLEAPSPPGSTDTAPPGA